MGLEIGIGKEVPILYLHRKGKRKKGNSASATVGCRRVQAAGLDL